MTSEPAARATQATTVDPQVARLPGPFGCALTVDVEEWYHTCMVPEFVWPERRPAGLPDELDRLLPELLQTLADAGRTATFFVLGEVAERLPARVREIAERGHEVASHHYFHLRAGWRKPAEFRAELERSKALLEDLVGQPVSGFRAPEWSLRRVANPLLRVLPELGFDYDSSLVPAIGSGDRSNPRWVSRLHWGGESLAEFPPLVYGRRWRLPASGWTGRLRAASRIAELARRHLAQGGLPTIVVHPWELSGRPTPVDLTGLARFVHETARWEYPAKFGELLRALPWQSLRVAGASALPTRHAAVSPLAVTQVMPRPPRAR